MNKKLKINKKYSLILSSNNKSIKVLLLKLLKINQICGKIKNK
jgi:hypothetical protein